MSGNLTYKTFPDFDFAGLKLTGIKPSKNKNIKTKFCNIETANGGRISVETPAMRIPWDIKIKRSEENGQFSAKMALSFQGMDSKDPDCKLSKFHDFLAKMDARVKALVTEKKSDLWSKNMDTNTIDAAYQCSLKESVDERYAATFQSKIGLREGVDPSSEDVNEAMEMTITVFRKDKTPVPVSELRGQCLSSCIVDLGYVWVSPLMVGITWNVKFVLVEPKKDENQFQFTEVDEFQDVEDVSSNPVEDAKRKRESDDSDNSDKNSFADSDYGNNEVGSVGSVGSVEAVEAVEAVVQEEPVDF